MGSASTMPATRLVYKILFLFSFAISFIITFKAEQIIRLIFGGEYAKAYLPMTILFWSILFTYFNTFTLNLLTVYNKQKYNFFATLLIVVVQIILVVILNSNLFLHWSRGCASGGRSGRNNIFHFYFKRNRYSI